MAVGAGVVAVATAAGGSADLAAGGRKKSTKEGRAVWREGRRAFSWLGRRRHCTASSTARCFCEAPPRSRSARKELRESSGASLRGGHGRSVWSTSHAPRRRCRDREGRTRRRRAPAEGRLGWRRRHAPLPWCERELAHGDQRGGAAVGGCPSFDEVGERFSANSLQLSGCPLSFAALRSGAYRSRPREASLIVAARTRQMRVEGGAGRRKRVRWRETATVANSLLAFR